MAFYGWASLNKLNKNTAEETQNLSMLLVYNRTKRIMVQSNLPVALCTTEISTRGDKRLSEEDTAQKGFDFTTLAYTCFFPMAFWKSIFWSPAFWQNWRRRGSKKWTLNWNFRFVVVCMYVPASIQQFCPTEETAHCKKKFWHPFRCSKSTSVTRAICEKSVA
jgi:hypothetical protein